VDTEAFLDGDVLAGLPERAWLDGPAELVIAEQVLYEVSMVGAATVYEIADDHLGLVVETGGLRLLASAGRGSLRPVLVEPTLAVPDPSWSADGVGLRFPAGTPVDVTRAIGGAVPLVSTAPWLEGSGWVSLEAVDDYAVWAEPSRGWSGTMLLSADTPLLDAADGAAFAWVTEDVWAVPIDTDEEGWQRVEITRSGLSVQGYVPARPWMGMAAAGGFGSLGGCGFMIMVDEEPTLPAGTVLRDAPDGSAVGVVLRDRNDPILDREDGLALFGVETPWGVVELWESD
jgi:hypothetical protein